VQQVEPLRKLIEARQKLSDLLSKMDGNDRLEELLQEIIQNTSARNQLGQSLGLETAQPADEGEAHE
jgi:type VI secretion system protein ImpB